MRMCLCEGVLCEGVCVRMCLCEGVLCEDVFV